MNPERLVEMANQIGGFFAADNDHAAAVAGIASHIKRFWEKRMVRAIIDYEKTSGAGLSDAAREAIRSLSIPV